MGLPQRPDAIVAYNDATALQALRACQVLGLSVPRDLAVVGFDDLEGAAASIPRLTTIRVDKEELGRRGVEALLKISAEAAQIIVPVTLVVRESSLR